MPDQCPACGTPVERPPDEVDRYCPNASCPGASVEAIVHFASRDAMDIRGLGYERVRQLLDAGLIHDVADLYRIGSEQLVELDRFAAQSAEQLVAAIDASRVAAALSLLFGLGIRHVGKTVAVLLARRFGTMRAADAARGRRSTPSGRRPDDRGGGGRVLRRAAKPATDRTAGALGAHFTEPRAAGGDGPLAGKTYVITGTLPTLSRAEATGAHRGGGRPGHRQRQQEDRCGRRRRRRREQAGEGEGARRRGHRRGRALASRRSQVLRSTVLNPLAQ